MMADSVATRGALFSEGPGGALFRPRDQKASKAIVYYHGWSSSVESSLFRGQVLAMRGHLLLIPRVILHDGRQEIEPTERHMALHFWRCVEQAVDEFSALASYLKAQHGIDKNHIAVTGHSMGGFIAGGILRDEPDISCGVLYNASLDWADSQAYFRSQAEDIDDLRIEDCAHFRANPKDLVEAYQDKDLLLTNGEEDRIVPMTANERFLEDFHSLPPGHGMLEHKVYPGVGHVMTDHMLRDGLDFIDGYL